MIGIILNMIQRRNKQLLLAFYLETIQVKHRYYCNRLKSLGRLFKPRLDSVYESHRLINVSTPNTDYFNVVFS